MRRRDHDQVVAQMKRENDFLKEQIRDLHDRLMYLSVGHQYIPQVGTAGLDPENDEPTEHYSWNPEQEFDASLEPVEP